MDNEGVDKVSLTRPLSSAPQHESPWIDYHLWYQTKPDEVPTTDSALELISHLARHDMNVITLPALSADDDPHYADAVMNRAERRGVRVIPNVSARAFDARGAGDLSLDERFAIVSQWFDKGARGVELGIETVDPASPSSADEGHEHAGWNIRELQAWTKFADDEAVISMCLRGPSFSAISDHALDDFVDVLRFEVIGAPQLEAENYLDQSATSFQLFSAAGALPSWNATWEVLTNIPGRLSRSALLLATCYMPGIVHFEKGVHTESPSTRHALRMRDALGMYKANVLIDVSKADDGFIWLINDSVSMLLNFGPHPYEIPNDGRVLVSSMIALPENGPNLVVPPGEAAWIRR